MTRRLPGKKLRTELFHVDGAPIVVEVRITDEGEFFCAPDDNARFEAPTLHELRAKLKPYLEETRRLTFDPFIDVEYIEADERSRFDNLKDRATRQEAALEFTAGWLSRGEVGHRRRWVEAAVDEKTAEIVQPPAWDRQHTYSTRSSNALIPFTPDRWRRLCAIADALADVRKKIAEVLSDATGKKLEAMVLPKLLEAPTKGRR